MLKLSLKWVLLDANGRLSHGDVKGGIFVDMEEKKKEKSTFSNPRHPHLTEKNGDLAVVSVFSVSVQD